MLLYYHCFVSVRDQFYSLDNTQIEDTIREAALDEPEYNKVKADVKQICSQLNNTS